MFNCVYLFDMPILSNHLTKTPCLHVWDSYLSLGGMSQGWES